MPFPDASFDAVVIVTVPVLGNHRVLLDEAQRQPSNIQESGLQQIIISEAGLHCELHLKIVHGGNRVRKLGDISTPIILPTRRRAGSQNHDTRACCLVEAGRSSSSRYSRSRNLGGAFLQRRRLLFFCLCGTNDVVQFNLLDIGCWRPTMKNVARDAK